MLKLLRKWPMADCYPCFMKGIIEIMSVHAKACLDQVTVSTDTGYLAQQFVLTVINQYIRSLNALTEVLRGTRVFLEWILH